MSRYLAPELLLIAIFTGCVVFQLFVPPSIGLANNGDFGKMVGRFALGPESLDSSEEYKYFTPRWVYNREFHWVSENHSSELILITAALLVGWEFSSFVFDIRILGAIHALLWIGCFAALLHLLRPGSGWRAMLAGLAALFIFTDVSYVAYFNSFYTDTAALLFLSWAIVLWLYFVSRRPPSVLFYLLFCVAGILAVASKSQHAFLAPFLFILAVVGAFMFETGMRKIAALAFAFLILAAAVRSFTQTVEQEKLQPQHGVIFYKILKRSSHPLDDLRELGLGPEYLRYVDYVPAAGAYDPKADPAWSAKFLRETGTGRIAWFYLRHPWRAMVILYGDLHGAARDRRPPNLGNFGKQYGREPVARTTAFGWWSYLRSALFWIAPWHILLWYAAVLGIGIMVAIRGVKTGGWRVAVLCVLLAGMGLIELLTSSLADSGETDRHLFLFHVITDFTIVFALVWLLEKRNSGNAVGYR
jgi:hypothetical protein